MIALVSVVTATAVPSSAATGPKRPAREKFYDYHGSLKHKHAGTVLKKRTVKIALGDAVPTPVRATQVLYRTTNQLRHPSATVATIFRPVTGTATPTKLLSYQTAYDGVSSTCRPSFQFRGGSPTNTVVGLESAIIDQFLAQGYTVVSSDYEGPTDDYGAGREEGYNTLDGIRAAEHVLHLHAGARVGMIGYSGGSIASEWASELQPKYAPKLHLIGVAEGGIPVDLAHNLAYISGSSDWAGAIPAVVIGLMRAYHLRESTYFDARGLRIAEKVKQGCLEPTAYPELHFSDLLKKKYKHWKQVPVFVRIFNDSIMGRTSRPHEPLLMGVGNADGRGDGVMISKDVQQLAHQYCRRGDDVAYHVYQGADHDAAVVPFETQAIAFLAQVYAKQHPASGCSSIKAGNALTPLPKPKHR